MNLDTQNNFSDIPALDDTNGLNAFLEQEAFAAQGITTTAAAGTQQPGATTPAPGAVTPDATATQQPGAQGQPQGQVPGAQPVTQGQGVTPEQLQQINQNISAINARLAQSQAARADNFQQRGSYYTPQEQQFVQAALARGYTLDQINATIMTRRSGSAAANEAYAKRIDNIEAYLNNQAYKQAETEFVNRVSSFGEKFGLSEQDLVTFGNAALSKGINIANPGADLETIFRAVYPEQYRIRVQRMTPTNTSQIYGGTSIPESNRAAASRMEDAYVNDFMSRAMPNYGKH